MLKKGLFAAALIVAIVVLAYEPAVLAAAAESTEQVEENDGFYALSSIFCLSLHLPFSLF